MAFVLALPERKEGEVDQPKVPRSEVLHKAVLEALVQQVSSAIRSVGEAFDPAADAAAATEAVHEARKSLKRIRSTLRLLRQGLGRKLFTAESQSFAKVGRALSATREAQVMVEVLHNLSQVVAAEPPEQPQTSESSSEQPQTSDSSPEQPQTSDSSPEQPQTSDSSPEQPQNTEAAPEQLAQTGYAEAVAAAQKAWQDGPHQAVHFPVELRDELLHELEKARARLEKLSLRGGIQRSLRSGLRRAVRRARRDWKGVCKTGPTEDTAVQFHELRKRVKDLYYMSALLQPAQPEFLGDLTAQLDELADLLGDDRDLTVLAERAQAHPEELGGPAVVTPLLELASYRQHALREAAQPLLESVLEVKPRRLARIIVQGLRERLE